MPRRLPTWIAILIPAVVFLVLAAAALFVIMTGELPPHARAEALETRFAEQIVFLRDLAQTLPFDTCAHADPSPIEILRDAEQVFTHGTHPDHRPPPADLVAELEALRAWIDQAAARADLFSDGAILGAEMLLFCPGGSTSRLGISAILGKDYQESSLAVSRALLETPSQWPVVSLWYSRGRRLVRYEDRIQKPSVAARGFRLIFDLEALGIDKVSVLSLAEPQTSR